MGIGDFLFGSSGGIETKKVSNWNKQQQDLFKQMYGGISPGVGQPQQPTSQELGYQSFLQNYPQWASGVVNQAFSSDLSPYIQQMYSKDIIPAFQSDVLPGIKEAYAGPGYWGSERAGAEEEAYKGLGEQEAGQIAQANLGQLNTRQQALYGLLSQQPQVAQQAANWSRYLQNLNVPSTSPYWQAAMQLMGLQPFTTVGGVQQGSPGFLSSVMSSMGSPIGQALGQNAANWMGLTPTPQNISAGFGGTSSGSGSPYFLTGLPSITGNPALMAGVP